MLPELWLAIEYDTVGRHSPEYVGKRQDADLHKDRALRVAGWAVLPIRTGTLEPLGPHDLALSSVGPRALPGINDELGMIRGALTVDAYLR